MADKDFEISRRKALAGLGVVGVASAGAGLGTTAYFSDGETYEDNTIMAGEFGLTVEPNTDKSYVDQDGIGPDEPTWKMGLSDEGGAFYEGTVNIEDAKPGDSYKFCWNIKVENNPGYVKIGVPGEVQDDVGGVDVDDLFDTDELSTLGEEATATLSMRTDAAWWRSGWFDIAEDSLLNILDRLGGNGYGLPSRVGDFDNPDPLSTQFAGWHNEYCHELKSHGNYSNWITVCLEIEIPSDVGNEIQDATTSWDFLVYAEQCRHNDYETFADADLPAIPS